MRIISLSDYPDYLPDIEFKSPTTIRLIAGVGTAVVAFALAVAPRLRIDGGQLPGWWCYPVAAMLGVITLLSVLSYRKSLRSTNWLLRSSGNRQWIKFRTFLNDHLPAADPQIIELDRTDVAWVCPVKMKVTYLTRDGEGGMVKMHQTIRFLDIGLNGIDTSGLHQAIRREEQHQGSGKFGFRGKFRAYPVTVPVDGVIRLRWNDLYGKIVPGIDEAVTFFARWTRIRDAQTVAMDYTPATLASLPEDQQRLHLLELDRLDHFSALQLAKDLQKCSHPQASQYLDQS